MSGFPVYDFINTSYPRFNVCFISGVHGNERSGTEALLWIIRTGYFTRLSLNIRVIPVANVPGFRANTRYFFGFDINRGFIASPAKQINLSIVQLIRDCDLVIDIHDGWGYYLDYRGSIGSTISPSIPQYMMDLPAKMVYELNSGITDKQKKFTIIYKKISGTLQEYCQSVGIPYILVEISGQNDLQPINIRIDQVCRIVRRAIAFIMTVRNPN